MSKIISCGIIPYAIKDNKVFFFVGHPGGNNNDYWTMLKGQMENGEVYHEVALREFKEESGVDLSRYKKNLILLGQVRQSKKKDVVAYGLYMHDISIINPEMCRSNMADNCDWPEIDRYEWKTYDDIIGKTHETHKCFYDKIMKFINY